MESCLIEATQCPKKESMDQNIEEGSLLQLDFEKLQKLGTAEGGVIPCIAQDIQTGRVLMLGYVNRKALEETVVRKIAVFWSTSRNALWVKGDTSGDTLEIVEIRVNCEQNSLLYLVRPNGTGACHTRDTTGQHRNSCYYRVIEGDTLIPRSNTTPWLA
jgi:phosphoribosyl-AMP cyclohydrolase